MWSNTNYTWKIVSEVSIRVFLLSILCVLCLYFEPRKHYITEAELHPAYMRPRKESRVSIQTAIALIIFMPLLIISSQMLLGNYARALQGLLGWNLALIANAVTTEALKLAVARPRPDFFYRCFPDGVMTADLRCTGSFRDVTDGRKSFPSGHSSFAFCSLGFLAMWLRWKMRMQTNECFDHSTCIALVLATVISATRVCDNRHHWQDVAAGVIIGLVIAYLCYEKYCQSIPRPTTGDLQSSASGASDFVLGVRMDT